MNFSFFLHRAKYTAIYTTIKLKTKAYVREYKVLFFADKKWLRKKEKGHIVGYYMTCYSTSHMLAFKNGRQTITNNHAYLQVKAYLVVNHPEIALTLEKCLIQGKNHRLLYLNWALFYELCNFSWYLTIIE